MEDRKLLIPGTKGFSADANGNIYGPDDKLRDTYVNGDGYITTSIKTEEGCWVTAGVHRLVALAFHHSDFKNGRIQVNHRDCDIKNNIAENLEWVTPSENNIHSEIMRHNNENITLSCCVSGGGYIYFKNAYEASKEIRVPVLDIWDSVKNKIEVSSLTDDYGPVYQFNHYTWDSPIPVNMQKTYNRFTKKNHVVLPKEIKMLDIDTGDILQYPSLGVAAKAFGVNASHIFQSISKNGKLKLFQKKYRVAYIEDDFEEYSQEEIETAKNRGPKEVIAYNVDLEKYFIYNTAKEFIHYHTVSRKAVTKSLAENKLRKIGSWVVLYLNPENMKRIKTYVGVPATTISSLIK